MGRIKTKPIKRASRQLVEKSTDLFTESFDQNKKALGNTMPSKKVRNMIAGYIARLKKQNRKLIKE
ncbi:30S ribosomal protein S17e [uncultured archaeon]|nr:30S ribosomal protein S17e [uncultured archaeon]